MTELTKHEPTTIYIKPPSGYTALNLRDLWTYRELVYFMVWRDIKVRYKQTLLGAAWAILQPVLTMFVMFFLFRRSPSCRQIMSRIRSSPIRRSFHGDFLSARSTRAAGR